MSQNESRASEKEQGEPEKDSVFDFLYHDIRRVGSFLAQFDDAGHLQQITQSDGATRGTKRGWKVAAAGMIPTVGSANVALERGPEKGGFEASERVYDPLWANARTLFDYLSERGMLHRGLEEARIGQFVLVSGQIMVLDLGMLKSAWDKPTIKNLMGIGGAVTSQSALNRNQRRTQGAQHSQPKANPEVDLMVTLLSMLPHSLQARLVGESANVWCTLDENAIVGASSDLVLKHGPLLQGEWHMLGILDAFPEGEESQPEQYSDMLSMIAGTLIGQLQAQLAPIARQFLGRPKNAFGITPLLIFREILP